MLAEALKQVYAKVNPKYGETEVKIIGTRHGEKLYETLVTISRMEDYHSHNTKRLDVEGMKALLLKLNFIREDLGLQPKAKSRDYRSE